MILTDILSRLVAIAPRRERVAAPFIALLLVSTAVGAPIGTAAAASSTEECSGVDALIYDMVTVGEYSLADEEEHPCSPAYQRAQAIEELENASATQEEMDIYNAALGQQADNEVFTDVSANYLNDSRSIAWMHAETAIAEAYQDGKSKAQAKSAAKQAIQDYYAKKQVNKVERWNVSIASYEQMRETAENQSGITQAPLDPIDGAKPMDGSHTPGDSYVGFTGSQSTAGDGDRKSAVLWEFTTREVELVNGSTKEAKAVKFAVSDLDDNSQEETLTMTPTSGQLSTGWGVTVDKLAVQPPNEDYDRVDYLNPSGYKERFNKVETMNSDLQSEVDPFVNGTWTAFQDGQISASDVISRNNLMFRYGTDALNNSNASLYDSTAALSTMGVDTPNINSTGSMTVEYDGVEYTGMVLAREAPNGTWETGTTYNTSEIGGVVLLATTDGERIDMEGEFTLQEMKNQDGDQIQETQATKVVYKTSNTTELLDKMERILELRAQVEATKPKAGGGGTSDVDGGSGLFESLAAFLGISAGAAAVVVLGVGVIAVKIYSP